MHLLMTPIHLKNHKIPLVQHHNMVQLQTAKVQFQRVSTHMVGKIYRYLAETNDFRIQWRSRQLEA